MKCPVCKERLSSQYVDLAPEPIKVCMTCFFDDSIPNASSRMYSDADERRTARTEAIQKRASTIIEKYCK